MARFTLLLVAVIAFVSASNGQKLLMNDTVCVSDSKILTQKIQEPVHYVVAGCAQTGVPGTALTWDVRIEGRATESAKLHLTFPLGSTPMIVVDPPAIDLLASDNYILLCGQHPTTSAFVDCSTVRTVKITGIPEGTTGRFEVELPTVLARSVSSGSITISQPECGLYEEPDFYGYHLLKCDPILPAGVSQRSITLSGVQTSPPGSELAVAALSGSSGTTCREWLSYTNATTGGSRSGKISVPRLGSADCCGAEQVIFARDRAPWFASSSYWASWAKNDFTAKFDPSRILPVHIWVFRDDPPLAGFDSSSPWTSPPNSSFLTCDFLSKCDGPNCCNNGQPGCLRMCEQAEEANRLFSANLVGIQLDYVIHHAQPANGPPGCSSDIATNYQESYEKDALNVYYTDPPFGNENCSNDRKVIFLGDNGEDLSVLAHEIGHALGLAPYDEGGHADQVDPRADLFHQGFGSDNVMWADPLYAVSREKFSLGQVFRMHTHCTSLLHNLSPQSNTAPWNWLGLLFPSLFEVRTNTDVIRTCYPRDRHLTCPDIRFDVAKP